MNRIMKLMSQKRYQDAGALACYLGKTEETREALSRGNPTEEKLLAYENLLLFDAPNDFDCYCRYLDFRQPNPRNFYLDRRKYLKPLNDIATKMFIDDKYDVARVKMRTRSGKSADIIRLALWVQGNNPLGETLYCVGGGNLKTNIFEKLVEFIDEYWDRHCDIFPDSPKREDIRMSKEFTSIWLRKSEYADISVVTVGGSIEGFVQCTNLLIMDDLVSSNEINSAARLTSIYQSDILNAIMRRYVSGKMVLIGTPVPTLTNVTDPLDAFYENRQKAEYNCIQYVLPTINDRYESNYAYRQWKNNKDSKWVFTTEEMLKERHAAYNGKNAIEKAIFDTIYQMKPMAQGERRFSGMKEFEHLPDGRYREITVLDPADTGEDSAVCWYCRVYDKEPETIYAVDVFMDKRPMDRASNGGFLDDLVDFLIANGVHFILYESNMGGTLLGEMIKDICKARGWMFRFETYKQMKNKVQRIWNNATFTINKVRLRKHCNHRSYEIAKEEILAWSEKANHDDSIDCMTKVVEVSEQSKPKRIVFTEALF